MDEEVSTKHIVRRFDEELQTVRNRVLKMGGLVEQQVLNALAALRDVDSELAEQVISRDAEINGMEVAIDEECTRILVRRQPAATDLRTVIAVIKTITDLERIGDEAERIARTAMGLAESKGPSYRYANGIQHLGNQVRGMVHGALDAFARLDVAAAVEVVRDDRIVDGEYDALMRQMMTFMMEDPRSIGTILQVSWAARALERVGDHAKNISEYIIFLVKGKDVRHTSIETIEQEAKS
jgi:phosphate transport system protein